MKNLSKRLSNHFFSQDISLSNKRDLKNIVNHLNKKGIIIVSGIIGTNKLSIVKDIIIKTKMQENFFYFNGELDINHKIAHQKDLEKIYNKEKIIILENIDSIDKAENFIHTQFKNGNKIILIGNALHIKGVAEIEILPPHQSVTTKEESSKDFFELLAHKIITKDIFIKQKLKNFSLLNHTIQTLAQNRKLISVREIHKIITSQGSKISQITLIEYINYILESKLIKKILRHDLKTDNTSTGKAKYLFTDTTIRNTIVHNSLSSLIVSENNVFQHLERQGYNILTGKNGTFNFSFIATGKSLTKPLSGILSPSQEKEAATNIIVHVSKHSEKNEIKKEAKKLLKIPGDYSKYLIVESIKEIGVRPSTYLPVKIMEIDEFIEIQKL